MRIVMTGWRKSVMSGHASLEAPPAILSWGLDARAECFEHSVIGCERVVTGTVGGKSLDLDLSLYVVSQVEVDVCAAIHLARLPLVW